MRKPVSQKRRKGPDQGRRSAESKQRHTAHVGRGIDEEKMRRDTPHFGSGLSEKPLHAHEPASRLVPYDETLLERARVQWQFGDWDSLAALDRVTLQHHPERGRLALLAAAGYLQK